MKWVIVVVSLFVLAACVFAQPDVGDLYQTADWKSEKHAPVIEM